MPQYVRQRRQDVNCGPVAIVNALKWAGRPISARRYLPYLEFATQLHVPEEESGVLDHNFDRVLRYAATGRMRIRKPKRVTLKLLDSHLKGGGAIAVGYYQDLGGHYTLLIGTKGQGFIAVNDSNKPQTLTYKRRATVARWVKNRFNGFWLLEKTPLVPLKDNCLNGNSAKESYTIKTSPSGL